MQQANKDSSTTGSHHKIAHDVHKLRKLLTIVGSLVVCLLVAFGVTYLLSSNLVHGRNSEKATQRALEGIKKAGLVQETKSRAVDSTFGFSFRYNPTVLEVRGQVTDPVKSQGSWVQGEEFSDKELEEPRAYSLVRVESKDKKDTSYSSAPNMTLLTNIRKSFWSGFENLTEYKGLSKIDMLTKRRIAEYLQDHEGSRVAKQEDATINGNVYKRVVFATDHTSLLDAKTTTEDDYYFTVKNDRPYEAHIYNVGSDPGIVAQLEGFLKTVSYSALDQGVLGSNGVAKLASSKVDLPEETSKTLEELDASTLIDVILKNQPATVRIATISCGDIKLYKGVASVIFEHVCQGEVGSGSIITNDGYIATNGHVVTVIPRDLLQGAIQSSEALDKLLNYFVEAGITDRQKANDLKAGVLSGDKEAVIALTAVLKDIESYSGISVASQTNHYGIQLGNDPMRLNETRSDIRYTSTILAGKLIDKDFNPNADGSLERPFTASDVAILKVEGKFPTIELGSGVALAEGDKLTAIGFPGYTDNNLNTTQVHTVPTITQGYVLGIGPDAPGSPRRIIHTDVQIAQGNSGGPALDNEGRQIGLNTYGRITCPDFKCFGDGSARDVADLKVLLAKHNISPSSSTLTKNWHDALDNYKAGNYKKAENLFTLAQKDYPPNYLAVALAKDARSQIGGETDISSTAGAFDAAYTVLLIVIVIGVVLAILIIGAIVYLSRKHRQVTGLPVPRSSQMNQPISYQAPSQPIIPVVSPLPATPQPVSAPEQLPTAPVTQMDSPQQPEQTPPSSRPPEPPAQSSGY